MTMLLAPPSGSRSSRPRRRRRAAAQPRRARAAGRRRRLGAAASASISRPMPKMKTHSGAKKRFRKTGTGKLRARHSFTSHNLGKKSAKRKRHLGRPGRGGQGGPASGSRGCCTSEPGQAFSSRAQEAPRDARAGQGLPRPGLEELQARQGGPAQGRLLRLPRPAQPQARLPPAVDRAHQRRRPAGGHVLQPVHARPEARPASSSTARCWPTSPCATPRRSDVLPRRPGRPWPPNAQTTEPNFSRAPSRGALFRSQ